MATLDMLNILDLTSRPSCIVHIKSRLPILYHIERNTMLLWHWSGLQMYDIVCQPTILYVDIRYPRVPRIQKSVPQPPGSRRRTGAGAGGAGPPRPVTVAVPSLAARIHSHWQCQCQCPETPARRLGAAPGLQH